MCSQWESAAQTAACTGASSQPAVPEASQQALVSAIAQLAFATVATCSTQRVSQATSQQ